jgi:hypothetical protein
MGKIMFLIKSIQWEIGFNGNFSDNGIQNAGAVAWKRCGEMFESEVTGVMRWPQQRKIFQRFLHLLLLCFCATPLNQLHHDDPGQGDCFGAVGGKPGQGCRLPAQNIHHDIGIADDHDNVRFWACSRKDLAKALLSVRFRSFQMPTRGEAANAPAVPAADGVVTAGDIRRLTYLPTRKL